MTNLVAGPQEATPFTPMYPPTANHQAVFIDTDHARIDAEIERVNRAWLFESRNVAPID